jgi:uncharacterized protein YbjQ (UPF0145 family)
MSTSSRAPADLALDALRGQVRGNEHLAVTVLSVDEAILLDQVGYEPVGFFTGAAVVQLAAFARLGAGFSTNTELDQLSDALATSRRRAVERLAAAGQAGGADGVVGVALDIGDLGGGSRLVHLVASGTGVRGGEKGAVGKSDRCFTAALSGQEVHLLARAGYRPLGIVSGVCAYHVGRRGFSSWASGIKDNQEMTIYTEALYDARELAMGRLQDEAIALGADGVIGVTVSERTGVWGTHVIEFAAIGTAVVLAGEQHQPLRPRMIMDLAGN